MDTPLDNKYLDEKILTFHRTLDLTVKGNYFLSAIPAITCLMQHIYLENRSELQPLVKRYIEAKDNYVNNELFFETSDILDIFDIPDFIPVVLNNYFENAIRSFYKKRNHPESGINWNEFLVKNTKYSAGNISTIANEEIEFHLVPFKNYSSEILSYCQ